MRIMILSGVVIAAIGCSSKSTTATDTGSWWDTPGSTDGSGSSGEEGEEGDEDDEDDEDDHGEIFWGEVSKSESYAAIGFFHSTADSGVLCDMEYEVESYTERTDCSDCSAAYDLVLGGLDIFEESADGCTGSAYASLSGTFSFGISGETLYIDDGSGWAESEGYAESEGEDVFFEIGSWAEGEDDDEDDEGDEEEDE